jgi:hypothetical protein
VPLAVRREGAIGRAPDKELLVADVEKLALRARPETGSQADISRFGSRTWLNAGHGDGSLLLCILLTLSLGNTLLRGFRKSSTVKS